MKYTFDQIAYNITKKKQPVDSDREFYIGLEHIDPETFTISRWGSDITPAGEKLLISKGDILFGKRRAYQRKVAIAPFDGIFSAHGMVLRPKEDVINPDFFPFFIASDQFMETAVRISVGGLSPTINWKDLKNQEFELPPIEDQEVLADKLWAAYRLKEAYKRLLSATDEMVKSQFIEMFGCDKCAYLPLREVCLRYGEYGSNTPSIPFEEGHPRYIRITDLNYDGTLNDDKVCAKEIDNKYILSEGDFLFARTGATVGKTYCHTDGDALYAGYLIRYVTNPDKILPKFLSIYTKTQSFWSWIKGQMKIGAQPNISSKQYNELPVPVPSIEEQTSFLSFVRQADKSKFELNKAIEAIDQVIKSLING